MVIECLRYGSMKFLLPDGDGVNIQITPLNVVAAAPTPAPDVTRRCPSPYPDFIILRCGRRHILEFEDFGRTVSSIYNRSHPSLSGAGFAAFIEVVS